MFVLDIIIDVTVKVMTHATPRQPCQAWLSHAVISGHWTLHWHCTALESLEEIFLL